MSTYAGDRQRPRPATIRSPRSAAGAVRSTPTVRLSLVAARRFRLAAGLRELALLAALWLVYSASRLVASDDLASARHRAADLLGVERLLHLDVESWLNRAVAPVTQLAVPMSFWYASLHYVVTPAVLAFLFFRRREAYPRARNAIVIGTALALVAYLLLPTAPPRLMPGGQVIDVLAGTAQYGWWSDHASAPAGLGGLTNELAALPSLHVGWTVWVAWALWRHVGRLGRGLACLYVAGTTFVVIATGNHWVLDAVAGAAVIGVGVLASGRIARRAGPRRAPVVEARS